MGARDETPRTTTEPTVTTTRFVYSRVFSLGAREFLAFDGDGPTIFEGFILTGETRVLPSQKINRNDSSYQDINENCANALSAVIDTLHATKHEGGACWLPAQQVILSHCRDKR